VLVGRKVCAAAFIGKRIYYRRSVGLDRQGSAKSKECKNGGGRRFQQREKRKGRIIYLQRAGTKGFQGNGEPVEHVVTDRPKETGASAGIAKRASYRPKGSPGAEGRRKSRDSDRRRRKEADLA